MRSYTSNATRARNDKGVIKKKESSIRERVRGVRGVRRMHRFGFYDTYECAN